MSDFDQDQFYVSVQQLKSDAEKHIIALRDPVAAVRAVALSLNGFIDKNFELISGNENMVEVNTVLVTSLAQIKNYLLAEPSRVVNDINNAASKLEAYDQCLKLYEASREVSPPPEQNLVTELEQDTVESEIKLGTDEDIISDEKPDHEELWNKPSDPSRSRRVGQRPESLRKIRQEMFKNQGEESQPEDI